MVTKEQLEVGDTVYVVGIEGEVWDLVPSNTALIGVLMKDGPAAGQVLLAVLKQVTSTKV
jgi:hypothetical protein